MIATSVDAALFYGRIREIAEALEALRQMPAVAERRSFMILGASSMAAIAGIFSPRHQ